ncbi:MAG: serine O-acetyltransferase [Rhodoferax sp.]
MSSFKEFASVISMDVQASTGRRGLTAVLSALIYEPGFSYVFFHRIAVLLYSGGLPRFGKFIWKRNSVRYGCYLHLHAKIAGGLKLPHPVGVVVGEGVEIEEWVTLYQGVTLGKGSAQNTYPTIGTRTTVFANAIVFGAVRIGSNAVIGAGAIVNKPVTGGDVVAGNPAKSIHSTPIYVEVSGTQ